LRENWAYGWVSFVDWLLGLLYRSPGLFLVLCTVFGLCWNILETEDFLAPSAMFLPLEFASFFGGSLDFRKLDLFSVL
jgi:hypothetical protein